VPTDGTFGPIQAIGEQDVTISAFVTPTTLDETTGGKIATSSVTLFWVETALSVGTAPGAGFTSVAMTNTGGNTWEADIPARDTSSVGKRVWFYVLSEDADGNFDRSPEIDEGYYTYDQKPFDACDFVTFAPSSLAVAYTVNPDIVAIKWPRVTTYTGGSSINKTVDPIVYQIWRRDEITGSFTKIYEVPEPGNPDIKASGGGDILPNVWYNAEIGVIPASTAIEPADNRWFRCNDETAPDISYDTVPDTCYWWNYLDPLEVENVNNKDMMYYVITENSCDADRNTSAKSSFYRECVGASSAVISTAPSTINAGDGYVVTVNDCLLAGNLLKDSITVKNIATTGNINLDIGLTEDLSDTGIFTGTLDTTTDVLEASSKVFVSAGDIAPDTITVSCPVVNGCTGPPTPATVTVNAAPCDNTPSAPTGLSGVRQGANVDLSWTANAELDIAFYNVYRQKNAEAFVVIAQVAPGSDPVTYSDKPAQLASNDYSYYVTAVDTCSTPQESSPSSTVGPF
jgi:hypothetical protein